MIILLSVFNNQNNKYPLLMDIFNENQIFDMHVKSNIFSVKIDYIFYNCADMYYDIKNLILLSYMENEPDNFSKF